MAELLILAFDTYGPDEEQDRFAWKLGHVIDVKPDGHIWGSKETLPKFWKIKLPGIEVSLVQKFLDNKYDFSNPDNPIQTAIRKWKLDANILPTNVLNSLMNTGEYTVTKKALEAIEGYMVLV